MTQITLTETERLKAYQRAQKYTVARKGTRPTRDQYADHTAERYPQSVTRMIIALAAIMLFAVYLISAMRLYHIGSQTFAATIADSRSATAAGIATVVAAETGATLFVLAAAALTINRLSKSLLTTGALISTLIALVGNYQIALVDTQRSPFAYLEALAPPVLVLITAWVLKEQLLHTIEQRHANERAYQTDLANWTQATANPEADPTFARFWATALKEIISTKYRNHAWMKTVTLADWRQIVAGEMNAQDWWTAAEQPPQPPPGPIIEEEPPREEDTQQTIPLSSELEARA